MAMRSPKTNMSSYDERTGPSVDERAVLDGNMRLVSDHDKYVEYIRHVDSK